MRRIRRHLTYANVISTLALFLVLGGGTALAAYVVSSNSQIGPGTVSGHKPPTGDHANIIAGSVNGQDVAANSLTGANINEASLTGDVQKLVWNAAASKSPPKEKITTVGPYTLKGECGIDGANAVSMNLYAKGPAGTADLMESATANDSTDDGNFSEGLLIPANTDTDIATIGAVAGDYRRIGGTAMLKSGSTLVQVEYNAVADARSSGSCFIYGTATRAT
jgi:hypothetical protein